MEALNVLFLTEGGAEYGFGHLTRCMALAQAFERTKPGIRSEFFVAGDAVAIRFAQAMRTSARHLEWHQDVEPLLRSILSSHLVVVDSYRASLAVYEAVANACRGTLLMIDDENRLPYPPGIVVSPSVYGHLLPYGRRPDVKYLAGPDYVLLREAFWEIPEKKFSPGSSAILMTLGGSRSASELGAKLASRIPPEYRKHLKALHPHAEQWDAYNMRTFMFDADVCVTGGGVTMEEMACVGVPAIGIAFADHQHRNLEVMADAGCVCYIGRHDMPELQERFHEALRQLEPLDERRRMSRAGRKLIDGQGALRIAAAVLWP